MPRGWIKLMVVGAASPTLIRADTIIAVTRMTTDQRSGMTVFEIRGPALRGERTPTPWTQVFYRGTEDDFVKKIDEVAAELDCPACDARRRLGEWSTEGS